MYLIELRPKAVRDLQDIPKAEANKVVEKIKLLEQGLVGDIKRLTNFSPEYRLRIGNYRVLFEVEGDKIVIYRIRHRKEAYSQR